VGRLHRTLLTLSAQPEEVVMLLRSSVRHHLPGILGTLALLLGAVPAVGQIHDEARLTVGMALGYIKGAELWRVSHQPITEFDLEQDIFDLHRTITSNLTLSAQASYFPSSHLGYTGEFTYIGLGTEDNCQHVGGAGGDPGTAACAALSGVTRPGSSVSLMGGVIWRPISRTAYQPFVRGLLGAAVVPRSTLQLSSTFGVLQDSRLDIYTQENSHMVRPSGTLGVGIATAPSAGYQLSIELRESWVVIPVVTGPTVEAGLDPPSANRLKAFPGFMVGLNIVLERRRGRRY
jgi:hypothetical protein